MVTSVTNLGRSGLADWLIQRISSIILALYSVFIVGYLLFTPDLDYATWQSLFQALPMRVFSLLALLSVLAHAWIGIWCVLTDYVTDRMMCSKAGIIRLVLEVLLILLLVAFGVWGIQILWGIS